MLRLRLQVIFLLNLRPLLVLLFAFSLTPGGLSSAAVLVIPSFDKLVEVRRHLLQPLELQLELYELVVLLFVLLVVHNFSHRLLVRRQYLLSFDAWTLHIDSLRRRLLLLRIEGILEQHLI